MRMRFPVLIVLSFVLLAHPAQADVVMDWKNAALQAIRSNSTPPPLASRALAMLHVAVYDAVNGIRRTHEPYFVTGRVPASTSEEAAASAAARLVLVSLFPNQQASFEALHNRIISRIPSRSRRSYGLAWGEYVAQKILALRSTDGSTNTVNYTPGSKPGEWRPTISFGGVVRPALLPQWGSVIPFGIASGSQFRPPVAPNLLSFQYANELNMVKSLGRIDSSSRTADQTEIALFWSNGAGTSTPPGHWNQIAQVVAADEGNSLEENARLLALLNIALADAAIVSWDCKYAFNYWRPITAIQEADSDGNPGTIPDRNWVPFLFTPPFPEYTSGHSTFSGAAAMILAAFYDRDRVPFTVGSDGLPGVLRSYKGFSEAAIESGASRIYGGIHFMSANVYGLLTGVEVGVYVWENLLRPKGNRSRDK